MVLTKLKNKFIGSSIISFVLFLSIISNNANALKYVFKDTVMGKEMLVTDMYIYDFLTEQYIDHRYINSNTIELKEENILSRPAVLLRVKPYVPDLSERLNLVLIGGETSTLLNTITMTIDPNVFLKIDYSVCPEYSQVTEGDYKYKDFEKGKAICFNTIIRNPNDYDKIEIRIRRMTSFSGESAYGTTAYYDQFKSGILNFRVTLDTPGLFIVSFYAYTKDGNMRVVDIPIVSPDAKVSNIECNPKLIIKPSKLKLGFTAEVEPDICKIYQAEILIPDLNYYGKKIDVNKDFFSSNTKISYSNLIDTDYFNYNFGDIELFLHTPCSYFAIQKHICNVETKAFCGNGLCEPGETVDNCLNDCGYKDVVCGNGICEHGETPTTCPDDCHVNEDMFGEPNDTVFCGNGICEPGEENTCFADCRPVTIKNETTNSIQLTYCGNGVCDVWLNETPESCPLDCKAVVYEGNCKINVKVANPPAYLRGLNTGVVYNITGNEVMIKNARCDVYAIVDYNSQDKPYGYVIATPQDLSNTLQAIIDNIDLNYTTYSVSLTYADVPQISAMELLVHNLYQTPNFYFSKSLWKFFGIDIENKTLELLTSYIQESMKDVFDNYYIGIFIKSNNTADFDNATIYVVTFNETTGAGKTIYSKTIEKGILDNGFRDVINIPAEYGQYLLALMIDINSDGTYDHVSFIPFITFNDKNTKCEYANNILTIELPVYINKHLLNVESTVRVIGEYSDKEYELKAYNELRNDTLKLTVDFSDVKPIPDYYNVYVTLGSKFLPMNVIHACRIPFVTATCGNHICESPFENDENCPIDCVGVQETTHIDVYMNPEKMGAIAYFFTPQFLVILALAGVSEYLYEQGYKLGFLIFEIGILALGVSQFIPMWISILSAVIGLAVYKFFGE